MDSVEIHFSLSMPEVLHSLLATIHVLVHTWTMYASHLRNVESDLGIGQNVFPTARFKISTYAMDSQFHCSCDTRARNPKHLENEPHFA